MNPKAIEPQRTLLHELNQAQRERLSYIDFKLYFLGELRRADVGERFGVGPAAATRDIALYKEMAPQNLVLNNVDKIYRLTDSFVPLFDHSPQRVLTALSHGFGEVVGDSIKSMIRCEFPTELSQPKMSILAPLTRAIYRGKAVKLIYTSVESGRTEREIVPIALVSIGIRWHVRAFDRRRKEFRDFVVTRMENPTVLENCSVGEDEKVENDVQWNRIIELELVPHPNHPRPEMVEMDYSMSEGVLRVKVRAANVGYMLRMSMVDCSPDHSLEGLEFALCLRDPLALYGANNARLAPGYCDPRPDVKRGPVKAW